MELASVVEAGLVGAAKTGQVRGDQRSRAVEERPETSPITATAAEAVKKQDR